MMAFTLLLKTLYTTLASIMISVLLGRLEWYNPGYMGWYQRWLEMGSNLTKEA
jgi:hypothetical protein